MKSYLLVCFVAVVITAAQGYRHSHMQVPHKLQDEALSELDNMEDPASGAPPEGASAVQKEPPNPHNCDCDKECHDLHDDRLPKEIQDEHNYLSYENFPVLCRDASSVYLPPKDQGKPQKKYVCKLTFDCCRHCNALFYKCLSNKSNTYGFCMRGAYKCTCQCIDKQSYQELPYPNPPALS